MNYPGSMYTLTFNEAADRLEGIYFQAIEKQEFEVCFRENEVKGMGNRR